MSIVRRFASGLRPLIDRFPTMAALYECQFYSADRHMCPMTMEVVAEAAGGRLVFPTHNFLFRERKA